MKWSTKHEVLGTQAQGWQDGRGRKKTKRAPEGTPAKLPQETRSCAPANEVIEDDVSEWQGLGVTRTQQIFDEYIDGLGFDLSGTWPSIPDLALDNIRLPTMSTGFSFGGPEVYTPQDAVSEQTPHLSMNHDLGSSLSLNINDGIITQPEVTGSPSDIQVQGPQESTRPLRNKNTAKRRQIDGNVHSSDSYLPVVAIPKAINDDDSVLVEFYFRDTAKLFSCYDGILNPFRTTISNIWGSSPLIYHSLTSMAAGCLADNFPRFGNIGRQHRRAATELLDQAGDIDESVLLSLLMIGGTSSWHNTNDLGIEFFNRLQTHLREAAEASEQDRGNDKNYQFLFESMVYWEMLLAFVVDGQSLNSSTQCLVPMTQDIPSRLVPHPWTGVSREIQILTQKVGRLVRQERVRAKSAQFTTFAQIRQLQEAIEEAEDLEKRLLLMENMTEEAAIINPNDRETPLWHLTGLAEVYRCTALLQLYRVFPDLLYAKVYDENGIVGIYHEDIIITAEGVFDESNIDMARPYIINKWMTAFAVKTLNVLRKIPLESGTRDFQPFLLVACSSELRIIPEKRDSLCEESLHLPNYQSSSWSDVSPAGIQPDASPDSIETLKAREMIITRLTAFLSILPPKPMRNCLDIVKASWKKMDNLILELKLKNDSNNMWTTTGDCYWVDIMIENKWETTMA